MNAATAAVVAVGGAQLLVLIAAALYARRQAAEAAKLREAQTRPYVVIDFDVAQTIAYLRITNLGQTMARRVRFTFDPPLVTTFDDGRISAQKLADTELLRGGIPTLAPGKTISTLFDHFPDRLTRGDLPLSYHVTIDYESDVPARTYTDAITLDLGIYVNLLHVERRDLHDVHERLKEIQGEIKRWSATGGGLLTLSPDDVRKRNDELKEARKRQAQRATEGDEAKEE